MDLVVILTVVIPAFLVAMGFYFFVVCVIVARMVNRARAKITNRAIRRWLQRIGDDIKHPTHA